MTKPNLKAQRAEAMPDTEREELRRRDALCQQLYTLNAEDTPITGGDGAADNRTRAAWALEALETFTARTFGGDRPDTMNYEDLGDAIGDLICDVMHLARLFGMDPAGINVHAVKMYAEELADEARTPDEA